MKCLNIPIRRTLFFPERQMVDADLGDLCATGDESSWTEVSMVVSAIDVQQRPFIDCTTSSEQTVINNSHRRYWIQKTSDINELKRNRRSPGKIIVDIPEYIGEAEMNRPKSVQLKIHIPKDRIITKGSLSMICPKSQESNKPQCVVKLLRLSKGNQIEIQHTTSSNITDFNAVQQNRVEVSFLGIEFFGKKTVHFNESFCL
ncbi:hypothetical protein D915_010890 [Fasciola hepatica]|uniref:Uncharacterized protein n=1 Tax=Fasciola hepatica TaxID=6192 RepID=A0A4E0R8T9_FASHE|nr:hypothetical protein D915_010890 [Fasciola hepatica]